jgi:hypothetical protein
MALYRLGAPGGCRGVEGGKRAGRWFPVSILVHPYPVASLVLIMHYIFDVVWCMCNPHVAAASQTDGHLVGDSKCSRAKTIISNIAWPA